MDIKEDVAEAETVIEEAEEEVITITQTMLKAILVKTAATLNKELIVMKIIEEDEVEVVEVLEGEGENLIKATYSVIIVRDMGILLMSATTMLIVLMLNWPKKRRR